MTLEEQFSSVFSTQPAHRNFTPGRVNLIGEHTDYNGGIVLPTALELGVSMAFTPRADGLLRIFSDKFDGVAERSIHDDASDHWSDYLTGAVIRARELGLIKGGADIAVQTTLPFGAGISSSAAITVGFLKLARDHAGQEISDTDIALAAKRVENDFIGMPCGIMDQMAVAIARPGQALALDTDTLEYELVDLPADYQMAVIHSGVFRQLSEGRYKIRKEECDAVKAALGHDNICRISDAELQGLSTLSGTLQRRARHCMREHRRTLQAVDCLKHGRMTEFGGLMNESHASMQDDFEITVPAIDSLALDAVKLGALGARMTGGGFGGCIVACVAKDRLGAWQAALLKNHPDAFAVC